MKHIRTIILLLALLQSALLSAQITGVVKDSSGAPVVGASVIIEGEKQGTVTDVDGKFKLPAIEKEKIIIISYVGMKSDTVRWLGKNPVEVIMQSGVVLNDVVVRGDRPGILKSSVGALNTDIISSAELVRAACCNLGESFTTNPSVDVNYSDAATGARQIKLLGLSGTYVQMLTENVPSFKGLAAPYSLSYVPGTWMQSIMVSKGAATVKNGYESITGQIDVEYKKPQADEEINLNLYGASNGKMEANGDINHHFSDKLSTGLFVHYENAFGMRDGNGDGFMDMPKVGQWDLMNRWMYRSDKYIMQAAAKVLIENRHGGMTRDSKTSDYEPLRRVYEADNKRYEAFAKNAFILDKAHNTNIALIMSGWLHYTDASYTYRTFDADERNGYASLMFESDITPMHNISVGTSANSYYVDWTAYDDHREDTEWETQKETVFGTYAQYTFNYNDKFVAMLGMRADNSSLHGWFATPRVHLKWHPIDLVTIRGSAGRGYRSVFYRLESYNQFLASQREFCVELNGMKMQEAAWNFGASVSFNIPIASKKLALNAEYYYTSFDRNIVFDYDRSTSEMWFVRSEGGAYSRTFQVDATYPIFDGFSLTAAYRLNDAKAYYFNKEMNTRQLREHPLASRYKCLITASYKTAMDIWQFDVTAQLNGGGRMPDPSTIEPLWGKTFGSYWVLNAQVLRWFKWGNLYVGGENLLNVKQKNPVINTSGGYFDATMVWGPVEGAMVYAGVKIKIGK